MNILTRIKNFFKIGGAKLGLTQNLEKVTDDPRVAIPSSEYERIRKAKAYYANDLKAQIYGFLSKCNLRGTLNERSYHPGA